LKFPWVLPILTIVRCGKIANCSPRADRKFADIDVVMQQRIDMLPALAQVVKKYDIHEYKALKDVIEARSCWTKDASLNEKVKALGPIELKGFVEGEVANV